MAVAGSIDRELVGSSLEIEVTATSGDTSTASQTFTIAINDVNEQPSAPADFATNAAENVNDTSVLATVTGTDPDAGGGNDLANNFENLSYAIQTDASGKFEVDPLTGAISLKAGESLNFEATQSHVVTVRVSDGPGLFDDIDVIINVTDVNEQPTDIVWNAVSPDEGNDVPDNGETLATLSTVDVEGGSFTYLPQAGTTAGFFNVSSAGVVTTTTTLASLQTYTLVIRSTDSGGLFHNETLTSLRVVMAVITHFLWVAGT